MFAVNGVDVNFMMNKEKTKFLIPSTPCENIIAHFLFSSYQYMYLGKWKFFSPYCLVIFIKTSLNSTTCSYILFDYGNYAEAGLELMNSYCYINTTPNFLTISAQFSRTCYMFVQKILWDYFLNLLEGSLPLLLLSW